MQDAQELSLPLPCACQVGGLTAALVGKEENLFSLAPGEVSALRRAAGKMSHGTVRCSRASCSPVLGVPYPILCPPSPHAAAAACSTDPARAGIWHNPYKIPVSWPYGSAAALPAPAQHGQPKLAGMDGAALGLLEGTCPLSKPSSIWGLSGRGEQWEVGAEVGEGRSCWPKPELHLPQGPVGTRSKNVSQHQLLPAPHCST